MITSCGSILFEMFRLDLSNLWMLMKTWSFFGFGGSFLMFWMEYERFETMEMEKNRGEPSCWVWDNSSTAISQWLLVIYRLKQPMKYLPYLGYFKKKTSISKRHLWQIQNIIKHMCFFWRCLSRRCFACYESNPKLADHRKTIPKSAVRHGWSCRWCGGSSHVMSTLD